MSTAQRILTDDVRQAIQAYYARYATRQAVTLPALHLVQERLGYVPEQAVVEIAELLHKGVDEGFHWLDVLMPILGQCKDPKEQLYVA